MLTFKAKLKEYMRTLDKQLILMLDTKEEMPEDELIKLLNTDKGVKVQMSVWREARSLNANNYFHALVHQIAEKLQIGNDECKIKMNLEYGTPATDEQGNMVIIKLASSVDISQFYDYAKLYATKKENSIEVNYYILYKQTHTLNSKEMARLIEGVVYEAKELGIETITEKQKQEILQMWESVKNGNF